MTPYELWPGRAQLRFTSLMEAALEDLPELKDSVYELGFVVRVHKENGEIVATANAQGADFFSCPTQKCGLTLNDRGSLVYAERSMA